MAETSSLSYELPAPYSGCQVMSLLPTSQYAHCTTTGLADIRDIVQRTRLGLFGHVACFDHDVPAASDLSVWSMMMMIVGIVAGVGHQQLF